MVLWVSYHIHIDRWIDIHLFCVSQWLQSKKKSTKKKRKRKEYRMFSPSYFTSSPLVLRRIRYRSADMRYRRNMAPLRDLKGPICSRFCCISPGGFITCCCCCYTRRFHRSNILRYYIFRVGAHVTNHCLQSRSTRLPT